MELSKIFTLKNANTSEQNDIIKIGQFEKKTVRIVIKTLRPVDYAATISSDSHTLIINTKNIRVLAKVPVSKITPHEYDYMSSNNVSSTNLHLRIKGKIVIDPGHGGYDTGAERDGIFEKDITLDVAKKVASYLKKAGVKVILTRSDDSTVSLKQRVDVCNDENPDAFVSIHVNYGNDPSATGLETHWYTRQSEALALQIQRNLVSTVLSQDRGIKNSMFYVIHHTEAPSTLVEIGFISNEKERYQLLQDERQNMTAKAISSGVLKFLGLKYSAENLEQTPVNSN